MQVLVLRKKRLKSHSHSHEAWHPRSTPTSGAGFGASQFQPRDLVLRRVFENTTDPIAGKFQPNWEGPYLIIRAGESGAYALDKLDGTPVPRMWNATHLKRYYQ